MGNNQTNSCQARNMMLVILGVLIDVIGSLLLVFVILFEHGVNLLGLNSLPLDAISLYVIAAVLMIVGVIVSLIGAKPKPHQENQEHDNV